MLARLDPGSVPEIIAATRDRSRPIVIPEGIGASLGNMNMTIGGDMQIRKEAGGQLALTGTVDTVRGTYEFQGRRFDLERDGTLRFTGSPQINPLLDVSATRQIPNTGVTARVHVTGTARAPQLALSSTPPLDEASIAMLIATGRTEGRAGAGAAGTLTGEQAGYAVLGVFATKLLRDALQGLGGIVHRSGQKVRLLIGDACQSHALDPFALVRCPGSERDVNDLVEGVLLLLV